MNPLVFMILFAEREMEIQLQKRRDQDAATKLVKKATQPNRKSRKHANCTNSQKLCERS
jgi:hypothetical protein